MLDQETGEPNGILLEGAIDLVWRDESYVRDSGKARKAIDKVLEFATSLGIRSVDDRSGKRELDS